MNEKMGKYHWEFFPHEAYVLYFYVSHQLLWKKNVNTVDACGSLPALALIQKQKPVWLTVRKWERAWGKRMGATTYLLHSLTKIATSVSDGKAHTILKSSNVLEIRVLHNIPLAQGTVCLSDVKITNKKTSRNNPIILWKCQQNL